MNMKQIADDCEKVQRSISDTMSACDVASDNVLLVLAFAAAAFVQPDDRDDFLETFAVACHAIDHVLAGGGHA
jgi:hypothetical protein